MIAYYSKKPIEELSIHASESDFLVFVKKISSQESINFKTEGIGCYPYQMLLSSGKIEFNNEQYVNIQVIGNELCITGSKETLSEFADEIANFAENDDLGLHLHIEYYDDHFYLSPDAVPLVIVRL
jgi:hypothetical protein